MAHKIPFPISAKIESQNHMNICSFYDDIRKDYDLEDDVDPVASLTQSSRTGRQTNVKTEDMAAVIDRDQSKLADPGQKYQNSISIRLLFCHVPVLQLIKSNYKYLNYKYK